MRGTAPFFAAVAALAVYAASLPGTFQFDDQPTILQNPAVRDAANLPRYFTDPGMFSGIPGNAMVRPVVLASYLANHAIAGYRPMVWHLTNVLLHALTAALVAVLAGWLLALFRPDRPPGPAPLLAGLAFALHPVHSEVANYVSARSDSLATAGTVAALLLHLAWTRGRARGAARACLLAASLLAFAAALGSKEIAVAFVPAVLVLELLDPAGGPGRFRFAAAVRRTAPALLLTVGYLYLRKLLLGEAVTDVAGRMFAVSGKADPYWGGGRTIHDNLITQARVFFMYAGLVLFPVGLAVDRFVRVSTSLTEPAVLLSLIGIAGLLAAAFLVRRRAPLFTFLTLFVFFGLAPTSTIVPLNVLMNEHRLYLPGVSIAIAMGVVVAAGMRRWPRAATALAAGVGLCWAAVIVPRSLVWQDPAKLWAENVRVSPKSFRAHNQLGAALQADAARMGPVTAARPLLDRAVESLMEARRLYPGWYNPELNLGIVWRDIARITGDDTDFERSVSHFERCREISPGESRARYQIATTYGFWKRYDEAIARFGAMADEDRGPGGRRLTLYLFPMAKLTAEKGDAAGAESLWRELLDGDPKDLGALTGLAKALADQDRGAEAVPLIESAIRDRPRDPQVHLAAANFHLDLTPPDRRSAAACFRRAMSLDYRPSPWEMERFLGAGR
jgi:tetratricopeptide (TPR) repeat protein